VATILTLNGSPSASSRTGALLLDLSRRLEREGHEVSNLNVRDLPASDLINARADAPAIAEAIRLLKEAHGVVIGTPIYKAAYTGVLKTFLDLLPQFAFEGKTLLPLATGGSLAHVLALDYGLRPVLSSLGARHVVGSYFIIDKALRANADGGVELDPEIAPKYLAALSAFTDSLERHAGELGSDGGRVSRLEPRPEAP
jgi:FMN reductase